MTQVSPQPDCVFPSSSPKSVGEMMRLLSEEPPLFFLTPFARAHYVLNDAWKLGWTFFNTKDQRFVAVVNPLGSGSPHACNEEACACVRRQYRGDCSHSRMVELAGGVRIVRQVLTQFDFSKPWKENDGRSTA